MTCVDHNKHGNAKGYSTVDYQGVTTTLHRKVYCEANGASLESIRGKVVRHTCDNPRCINPAHLIIGSYKDNSQDMVRRGRSAKLLTPAQVLEIRQRYKPRSRLQDSARQIAADLGVTKTAVLHVIHGRTHCLSD